jgi:hypothetical protein
MNRLAVAAVGATLLCASCLLSGGSAYGVAATGTGGQTGDAGGQTGGAGGQGDDASAGAGGLQKTARSP